MRIRTTLALTATALTLATLPAVADPEDPHGPPHCDDEVAVALHDVEQDTHVHALHDVEVVYCEQVAPRLP